MSEPGYNAGQQPSARAELEAQEWYDLLPVEKKLISYSLSLGIILLVIFILTFRVL